MKQERETPIWVQREEDKDSSIPQNEQDKFFEYLLLKSAKNKYLSEDLRKELEQQGYKEWITHPDINDPLSEDLPKNLSNSKKAQRKYEIFCAGFLYFYDMELKKYSDKFKEYYNKQGIDVTDCFDKLKSYFDNKLNLGKVEHRFFFEWGINEKNNNKDSVRIYITPPAGNPDPPTTPSPPPPESSN